MRELKEVSCSCSENGFAEGYGYHVILTVTMLCDVLYYILLYIYTIPHFQHQSSLVLCDVKFTYSATKSASSYFYTPFDTLQDVHNIS